MYINIHVRGVLALIVFRTVDLRNGIKKISEMIKTGEKVLLVRPHNENLVILSAEEYNRIEKICQSVENRAVAETTEEKRRCL